MEYAFIGGTISEDRHDNFVRLAHLDRQADAYRQLQPATNDAIGTQIIGGYIGDMHGTPASMAVTGIFAQKLGHHPVYVRTAGDKMPMATVVIEQIVFTPADGKTRAYRDGFLPGGKVHGAVDFAQGILLIGHLFKKADLYHRPVHLHQLFRAEAQIFAFRKRVCGLKIVKFLLFPHCHIYCSVCSIGLGLV